MPAAPYSARVRVRRGHANARYEQETIHAILDAGAVGHIGYLRDGHPSVTPTLYWREGETVHWHGSAASGMFKAIVDQPVCLSVAHLDGLVLARSAFKHSVNYRSATVFGTARRIHDEDQRCARLAAMMDHFYPGRWPTLRPMTRSEFKATAVFSLEIKEASAKIRNGGPRDLDEDQNWPVWAGTLPLAMHWRQGQAETSAIGFSAPDIGMFWRSCANDEADRP